jgi:hypothetical protein
MKRAVWKAFAGNKENLERYEASNKNTMLVTRIGDRLRLLQELSAIPEKEDQHGKEQRSKYSSVCEGI